MTSRTTGRDATAWGARGWHAAQALLVATLLLVVAGAAVAVVAPALGRAPVVSLGQSGAPGALLVLLGAAALVAAGVAAWFGRSGAGLALIAFAAAAAWLAPELAGSASVTREVRSLGLLLAPWFAALAAHLPMRTLGRDTRRSAPWWLLLALYATTTVASIGRAVTYDPFLDADCAPVCTRGDNLLALHPDMRIASAAEGLGLLTLLVAGLSLAAWAVSSLRRPGGAKGPSARTRGGRAGRIVLTPAAALGASMAWWAGARLWAAPGTALDPWLLLPGLLTAVCVTVLGAVIAATIVGEMRRAEALRRLADALDREAGSEALRASLARTLRDDALKVAYPLDDGSGFIDALGDPLARPVAGNGRAVTAIERAGTVVALVEHDAAIDPALLDREVGAAARLAVDNERLEATVRARLRELRASRARIVEAADAARGRLERDLHDGAQQRLLALSFELRLAATAVAQAGAPEGTLVGLRRAVDETDLAIEELRDLAHGIHPVVLAEDGLAGALVSLSEDSPVPLVIGGDLDGRCAGHTELAAYLAVVEAIRRSEVAAAPRLDIDVGMADGWLYVSMKGWALDDGSGWLRVQDRVGAAGGRVAIVTDVTGQSVVRVELPCGS